MTTKNSTACHSWRGEVGPSTTSSASVIAWAASWKRISVPARPWSRGSRLEATVCTPCAVVVYAPPQFATATRLLRECRHAREQKR